MPNGHNPFIRRDPIQGKITYHNRTCPQCGRDCLRYSTGKDPTSPPNYFHYSFNGVEKKKDTMIIVRYFNGQMVCMACAGKLRLFKKPFDDKPEPIGKRLKAKLGMTTEVVA